MADEKKIIKVFRPTIVAFTEKDGSEKYVIMAVYKNSKDEFRTENGFVFESKSGKKRLFLKEKELESALYNLARKLMADFDEVTVFSKESERIRVMGRTLYFSKEPETTQSIYHFFCTALRIGKEKFETIFAVYHRRLEIKTSNFLNYIIDAAVDTLDVVDGIEEDGNSVLLISFERNDLHEIDLSTDYQRVFCPSKGYYTISSNRGYYLCTHHVKGDIFTPNMYTCQRFITEDEALRFALELKVNDFEIKRIVLSKKDWIQRAITIPKPTHLIDTSPFPACIS